MVTAAQGEVGSPRTAELETILRENGDFRVRTQAAFSLGRLNDPGAVVVLLQVLRQDRHPAVRAAAAVALGRIGDPIALPHLRRHNDDTKAVSSQVSKAISLIEENNPDAEALDWSGAHYFLELDTVTNVSKTTRPGMDKLIRSLSMREMRRLSGVIAVDGQKRPPGIDAQLRRRKLPAYAISVSLGRLVRYMGPQKVRVQAEVMLAVVTYSDRVYRMTANGIGSVTIPRSAFRDTAIPALQEDALSGALRQAFQNLGQTLESSVATKSRTRGRQGRRR